LLALLTLGGVALALWAYRFAIPPLPVSARRALPALRALALALLLWLLAQPVLERSPRAGRKLVVLLDRSRSMDLAETPGGPPRAREAERAVGELVRGWRGGSRVEVLPFAARLNTDSASVEGRDATALGDALQALALAPQGQSASAVVVVSDGAVNAGEDPVNAARALGVPVHAVVVGTSRAADRAVVGVEASNDARVGRSTPVRVRISTTEERGTPIGVRLLDGDREMGRATVIAPGSGGEATAEFHVTPVRAGLAVWTARVDSLPAEITAANNSRAVAVEVAPGRLGVLILSSGLNWDLAFLRRALLGDSSLSVATWVRESGGFRSIEPRSAPLAPAALHGQAVVVLDALAPGELPAGLDPALSEFVHDGGATIALGGPPPGLLRYRGGRLGADLGFSFAGRAVPREATPLPAPEARELLAWDDDPARGERAWGAAAPLSDPAPIDPGAGDRVLIGSAGNGPPLVLLRRVGRGQALLVNGTGLWRWSLSGHDDLTEERGRRLWRGFVHWLAEPVQGEPLRVRPERWLTTRGETVHLFATLQDSAFRPIADAVLAGEAQDAAGRTSRLEFVPRATGSYEATLEDPRPGRYRVSVRAARGGRDLGHAGTEFAVDRWSLEEARTLPDSAGLAAVANATGGRVAAAGEASRLARTLQGRALTHTRTESSRMWESPWVFAMVVGALSIEWAWRRRRGLP